MALDTLKIITNNNFDTLRIDVSRGLPGETGEGVPIGGTTGQVLQKSSETDHDTEWSSDAFDMDNMNEGANAKIMTAAERALLDGATSAATPSTLVKRTSEGSASFATTSPISPAVNATSSGVTAVSGINTSAVAEFLAAQQTGWVLLAKRSAAQDQQVKQQPEPTTTNSAHQETIEAQSSASKALSFGSFRHSQASLLGQI